MSILLHIKFVLKQRRSLQQAAGHELKIEFIMTFLKIGNGDGALNSSKRMQAHILFMQ